MNEQELRDFMAARKPSAAHKHFDVGDLACYGCAHSAGGEPAPSRPSGERPCCACVRNPEREKWARDGAREFPIVIDDQGNARCFDPFAGTQYNGVPMAHHPMDRYVTLDQRDQDDWLDRHPEYKGSITSDADGNIKVVSD